MSRVYFDEYGDPHGLPVGRESAKKYHTRTYFDEICPKCGGKIFYTKNKKCVTCARFNAADLYGYAQGTMRFEPYPPEFASPGVEAIALHKTRHLSLGPVGCRDVTFDYQREIEELMTIVGIPAPTSLQAAKTLGLSLWLSPDPCGVSGHYGIKTLKNECYFCEEERNQPNPRRDARKNGERWYLPLEPCKLCGQLAERNVHSDSCSGCRIANSPRQLAIAAGKTWYVPTAPCVKCGTLSERNVHTGACKGCKGKQQGPDGRESPDSIIMKTNPDMIVSKEDAISFGMKVYRHGRPCNKGHRGFRYVSTNSCIDCLRGLPEVTL